MSDEFDSLDATEKAGIEAGLSRCRTLAREIESELGNKSPEHFVDKLSLAALLASLEYAARLLEHASSETANTMAEETPGADSVAVGDESQANIKTGASPNQQEIERRREVVRQLFKDFWVSAEDKPGTFAERLNRAEGHINERLAARGETWQLDAASRKQLGLPPKVAHRPSRP
jgi:hypothetical protein